MLATPGATAPVGCELSCKRLVIKSAATASGACWDLRETMPEDLVSKALRRALAVRHPAAGLLVHSD